MTAPPITTSPEAPARRATDRTWLGAHLGTLVVGAAVLLWVDRAQWFGGDEWFVATQNGLGSNPTRAGLFAPHFEHWSTLGVLVYKALFGVFAFRSYVPYTVTLIVVVMAVAHMSWRLLLRIGVVPSYATAIAALTMVMAVGWENRVLAWQITIIGPVALGFGALLVMPERGSWERRDLAVSGLLLLAVMCSGVGVTLTIVVAIAALLRRGWRTTVAIVGLPAAVYALWYVLEGTSGQRNSVALSTALGDLPDFVWRGLTGAFDGLTRVSGAGIFVLVALVIWTAWRARPPREPWPLVVATTIGAVVSLSLTAVRRAGAPPDVSRYSDIVVLLALPALALATQDAGRLLVRRFGRVAVAACTIAVVAFLVVQVVDLERIASNTFAPEMRARVLGTARIMRNGEPIASPNIFGIFYLAEPSATTIARMDQHGELPALDVSEDDVLTARADVGAVIGGASGYPEGLADLIAVRGGLAAVDASPDCVAITGDGPRRAEVLLALPAAASFRITSAPNAMASMAFEAGSHRGRPRPLGIGPKGTTVGISQATNIRLRVPPDTTLCGLATGGISRLGATAK